MDRNAVAAMIAALLKSHPGELDISVRERTKEMASFHVEPCMPAGIRNDCQRDTFLTLQEVGHRLTTKNLLDEMARRGRNHSESWVKENLAELVEIGTIDNVQTAGAKGKGYGLPGW